MFQENSCEETYCNCGEIVITGEHINEEYIHEPNQSILTLIQSNFSTIFRSEPNNIIVNKLDEAEVIQLQSNLYDIYCRNCKCGFRLIIGREYAYSCPIDDCKIQTFQSQGPILKRTLTSFFPINLRRFITERSVEGASKGIAAVKSEFTPTSSLHQVVFLDVEDGDDNDDDLESSFSSKSDFIVGSFADNWNYPTEVSF